MPDFEKPKKSRPEMRQATSKSNLRVCLDGEFWNEEGLI